MIISSSLKNGKTVYQSDGKLPYQADGKLPYRRDGKTTCYLQYKVIQIGELSV